MAEIHRHDHLRPLDATRYDGEPWTCQTSEPHLCEGPVVGAIGAYPVCANGVDAERAARVSDRARMERWAEENADLLAAEAEAEQAYERMANRY
jgi:hypothetical protein